MKPLTLAVCVTILAALVVGTCGCTSSSNDATATPTATPAAAGSSSSTPDATLSAIMTQIPGKDTESMSVWGARPDIPGQVSRASFSFFGTADGVDVMHFNSVANATLQYNKLVNNTASQSTRSETPNYWGLSYYTAAAGHAPTVKQAQTYYDSDDAENHESIIQYDNVVFYYTHSDNPIY